MWLCVFVSSVETKKTNSGAVVGVIVGAAVVVIAGLGLVGFYMIRSRRRSMEGKVYRLICLQFFVVVVEYYS